MSVNKVTENIFHAEMLPRHLINLQQGGPEIHEEDHSIDQKKTLKAPLQVKGAPPPGRASSHTGDLLAFQCKRETFCPVTFRERKGGIKQNKKKQEMPVSYAAAFRTGYQKKMKKKSF